jgi:hypothetical protein
MVLVSVADAVRGGRAGAPELREDAVFSVVRWALRPPVAFLRDAVLGRARVSGEEFDIVAAQSGFCTRVCVEEGVS